MLSFDLPSLRVRAVTVDAELAPDDPIWQEGDPIPSAPVRVGGRLSAAGADRFYWHGRIEGSAVLPCRRCLADTTVRMREEPHVIFSEGGEGDDDDPDIYQIEPGATELDLRPVIREQWLLHVPAYPLCRDECKGFCPRCGAELNAGPCDCPPTADSRWDALRKSTGESKKSV